MRTDKCAGRRRCQEHIPVAMADVSVLIRPRFLERRSGLSVRPVVIGLIACLGLTRTSTETVIACI